MYISASQKRIGSAVLLGAAVIAVSLYIRTNNNHTAALNKKLGEDITVTEAPKRTAIAVTDSNADGVPDWQEALVIDTPFTPSVTESNTNYTAPDTLTEQFSQQFFENMMRNKSAGDFGEGTENLVQDATDAFAKDAVDKLYTQADISSHTNNSPAALSAYGEAVAQILNNHKDTTGENEASILNRAITNNNADELAKLDIKIELYQNVITETKALSVPANVAKEHLDLLNAYQAILNDIVGMRQAFNDPMRALLRIKRYEDDALGLNNALGNLYNQLYTNGARWNEGSAVYTFIKIE